MDVVTEWFGARIMEKLLNTGFTYLQNQVRWHKSMNEELERLQRLQPMIQSVMFASSQAHFTDQNPAFNKWLWQLRDVIDEADDVLDEFEYSKLEKQLPIQKRFLKIGKRALKINSKLKRLEEVVKKVDKVSVGVGNFLHFLESIKQEQQEQQLELYTTRETCSLPTNDLIGRDKEKEFIMLWLTKPSIEQQTDIIATNLYRNISILSIVGHGGMGKTNLLQHVFGDKMTKEFDHKMWICVSSNFDAKKVIKDMLESLENKRSDLETLDALQGNLKLKVMSKKFLLVLDDIWEEEEEKDKSKWEKVLAPLACGSLGSKILVTTRMDSVALMIAHVIKKKKEVLRLEGLEEDECLQLLNNHAFVDVENLDDHRKLRFITGEIVKKLFGSPLAAKVIGGVLNSNFDQRHWMKVLNSDFGNEELGQNAILPILRLSIIFLPKHLQNCFRFCCMFPQHQSFKETNLVLMWIALGFIQPPDNSEESTEDIGRKYFNVLVRKSFFEKAVFGSFYYVHDLLHEVALSISAQEYFRVLGDDKLTFRIPETVRHLSIKTNNFEVLRKIGKVKKLRSLYLCYQEDNQDFVDVLTEIFTASRSIRLLYIDAIFLKMIPETIGNLIHLRFLEIEASATRLPRSLGNLYYLQFLKYDAYGNHLPDDLLPRDIKNLSNLHYLRLPWHKFSGGIYEIGKLTSLQELRAFHVKNESGYRIGQLEHMNELRELNIDFLENVKDANEACSAKLSDKRNLLNLTLNWVNRGGIRNNADSDLDEKVLENLQPYKNLERLSIRAYMGVRYAKWMFHLISNLQYINLHSCLECQTLPPFGQLPFLKFLFLENMPKVKQLYNKFHGNDKDCVFPSLEELRIKKLTALEDWFDAAAEGDDCLFPCLIKLELLNCPNLQELPSWPPMLKHLIAEKIGWKVLNCCSISKSTPLEILDVCHCPNITSLHLADEIALRNLRIQDCPKLISLRGLQEVEITENCQLIISNLTISDPSVLLMAPLRNITSIQKLTIEANDELVSFPIEVEQWFLQVRSSLCELNFKMLKSLQSLPSCLESLSSLKILCVENVPELQLLPNIPTSLERLELILLKSLQCLPSCLPSLSSLRVIFIYIVPLLRELPDLPPSLCELVVDYLANLNCLPSCLPSLLSLQKLCINNAPQLRELPYLPCSLCFLQLENLDRLGCLPSCLPSLSSLQKIIINKVPRLQELPELPPSLEHLVIGYCHPKLKERCRKFSGSDWHKIAHIPYVEISKKR